MLQAVAATQDPIEVLSQNKLEKSDLSATERFLGYSFALFLFYFPFGSVHDLDHEIAWRMM